MSDRVIYYKLTLKTKLDNLNLQLTTPPNTTEQYILFGTIKGIKTKLSDPISRK